MSGDTFHHVRDYTYFELPRTLGLGKEFVNSHGETVFGLQLPEILGLQLTKFMVLQLIAAGLALFIFTGLARRMRKGEPIRGRFWNFWEAIALFIRDEVVRPTIGDHEHHDHHDHHDHDGGHHHEAASVPGQQSGLHAGHPADKYLPFLWSCFFYILFCNLLGAVPLLGSATGNINVTGALAVSAFVATTIFSVTAIGTGGFFKNFLGGLEIKSPMDMAIGGLLFCIEMVGYLIKHSVLAVRLFANMMGGHTVLGVMLAFIATFATSALWWLVTPASILGQVGIGLLELFVAFLQAYVFVFLATIFISMGIHEH